MRTRLDEIIEEALGKNAIFDFHAYAAGKLIAWGAFHHGCVRTLDEVLAVDFRLLGPNAKTHDAVYISGKEIKPATASEKPVGEWVYPPAGKLCETCRHPVHEGRLCLVTAIDMNTQRALSDSCLCGDRRKSERRNGFEWKRNIGWRENSEYCYTHGDKITASGKDRRSGKGRRKPQ